MGGSQFQIYGEVKLDVADAQGNIRKVTSAIGGMGTAGAAGAAGLGQLNSAQYEATNAARLLAMEMGVNLPRSVAKFIGSVGPIQGILGAAFSAVAIGVFAGAIVAGIPRLIAWIDNLRGMGKELDEAYDAAVKFSNVMLGPMTSAQIGARIGFLTHRQTELKNVIDATTMVTVTSMPVMKEAIEWAVKHTNAVGAQKEELAHVEAELERLNKELAPSIIKEHTRAAEEDAKAAEKAAVAAEKAAVAAQHWATSQETLRLELAGGALEAVKRLQDAEEAATKAKEDNLKLDQAISAAGLADLKQMTTADLKATQVQIEDAQRVAKEQEQALEQTAQKIENFIDRVFLTAKSLSDVFHQFLMQLLGSFVKWASRMIAEAITGMRATATGGVGGGGGGLLGSILGGVFGLTPSAAAAGTGAVAVGATGYPGLAGDLSTMFGTSVTALGGGGGIYSATGGLTSGTIAPFSVAGGGGLPTATGGASAGLYGGLAFGKVNLDQLMLMGGPLAALAGAGLLGKAARAGGPITGAIGGGLLAGGATAGFVALASTGILGQAAFELAAAITGPVGIAIAAIGAGIGALIGAWGRGKAKEKAAGIEQPYELSAIDLLKQFKNFETDYNSALAGMQALEQQGQQAELASGTGKWGKKGAENLTMVINEQIRQLQDLQHQREAAATTIAGQTIPEFAVGGPVGFRMPGGGILAIVHPGEFVMQKSAVDILGSNFLAALNRAPQLQSGGAVGPGPVSRSVHVGTVNFIIQPQKGMTDREAMGIVVRGWRQAVRGGAL
jgi:hypothetical protein